ncbi:TetR/AcrR family transcriptional regulator [Labrenzia sp. PHM005]|nr:TetR/AcrR family transcriptional regulator [Labrenzia sp. PHM005]
MATESTVLDVEIGDFKKGTAFLSKDDLRKCTEGGCVADKREKPVKRSEQLKERRLKIVEAAAKLFIEKGFHQAGMRDIAGEAGISLGNLYNHFKGKYEIIAAISELEADGLTPLLEKLLQAEPGDFGALKEFAKAYYELNAEPAYAALAAEITAEVFRNPSIANDFLGTRHRVISAVERHLPADLPHPSVTAGLIVDLIEGAGVNAIGQKKAQQTLLYSTMLEFLGRAVGPDRNR